MKKPVSILFALSITLFLLSACSSSEAPPSKATHSFSSLSYDERALSSDIFYIDDGSFVLTIVSATWNRPSEDVGLGWYNVDTGIFYYQRHTGGSVANIKINSSGLPTGNYKVGIWNLGDDAITGAIQYSVS